jgi:uncharacterized membrane protein YhaH (DUF805 family)
MTMIDWYKKCIRQYADFSTRARRSEYWYFALANIIVGIILYALAAITLVSAIVVKGTSSPPLLPALFFGILILYCLFIFVPSLAVTVRRLHDIGKSGWWYFIGYVPLVGPILLLVWSFTDSQPGENQWGPNPKEININDYFNSASPT